MIPPGWNGIAIEAFLLREGHTGVERYILNLIRTVTEGTGRPVTIYVLPSCRCDFGRGGGQASIQVIPVVGLLSRVLFQHLLFPWVLRRFDRTYFTGYMGSLLYSSRRSVVSVFDLIALRYPRMVRFRTRWYYRLLLPWFIRSAALLIVPSEKVRQDVLTIGPRGRVLRLPLPIGEEFYGPAGKTEGRESILLVGYGEPKKNHHLLHAIAPHFSDQVFHLVGHRPNPGSFPPNVKVFGFLPQEELIRQYRQAKLLLFPSLEEGYGMPIYEALVLGTPVLTWPVAPFTEFSSPLLHHADSLKLEDLIRKLKEVVALPPPPPGPAIKIPRWSEYWESLERELTAAP